MTNGATIIKAPPPDLATLLIDLGPRRLVLLEGDTDLYAFNEWYMEREADVYFHVPGSGVEGVKATLQEALAVSVTKRVFGIIDRDFRGTAEVEASLTEPSCHLFILRRYSLENYLLEPEVIREELRVFYGADYVVPDLDTIRADLLELCRQLRITMAANWVLLDGAGKFLPIGFDGKNRETLIKQVVTGLAIDSAEAELRIAAKESLLVPHFTTLESAHTCTNGKFLVHKVYEHYFAAVRKGLIKDHLFNLLVRAVKRQGVHVDIRAIVEGRILP